MKGSFQKISDSAYPNVHGVHANSQISLLLAYAAVTSYDLKTHSVSGYNGLAENLHTSFIDDVYQELKPHTSPVPPTQLAVLAEKAETLMGRAFDMK